MKIYPYSPMPLYEQIKNRIVEDLIKGSFKPGDTFYSLSALAEKYAVSQITIRRVMTELVKEGYLITQRGKKPTVVNTTGEVSSIRSLSRNVGFFLSILGQESPVDLHDSPSAYAISNVIQKELIKAEYLSSFISVHDNMKFVKKVITDNCDNFCGFMFFAGLAKEILSLVENSNKPYVIIDRFGETAKNNYVSAEYYTASCKVANYLLDSGIKSLLFVTTEPFFFTNILLLRGLQETFLTNSIAPSNIHTKIAENGSLEAGKKMVTTCLKSQKMKMPCAIFTTDDFLAMGAVKACEEMQLNIPDDISIIGGVGLSAAEYFKPALSTLECSMEDMGRTAVQMLFKMLRTKHYRQPGISLPMRFVIRETVR